MKVRFFCNSGANIHSTRQEVVDLEKLGISDTDWRDMSEEEKYKVAEEWAWEKLEIGFEEGDS